MMPPHRKVRSVPKFVEPAVSESHYMLQCATAALSAAVHSPRSKADEDIRAAGA
jgi:hypothetical protein